MVKDIILNLYDYSTRFGCATCASQTAMVVENGKVELIKDIQLSD